MMDQEDGLQRKIENLEEEVQSLQSRVTRLENLVAQKDHFALSPDLPPISENRPPENAPFKRPEFSAKINRDNLESMIGGQLLNRIGIIVLLFGVAYFLKYSFDNRWINEVGRVIIGLIAGVSLLAAGDFTMGRRYIYFSQGLSGGGIGVIYLSTFAAANYYHIFSPAMAFGLLAVTALAGGVLSIRQNAFAVAILSTLGGFLTPFLIGSKSTSPVPLLSYIVVLDLVVLSLAYYKNWRSLNLLSFFGTAAVYLVYQSMASFKEPLLIELFLIVFFVIFGALTFFYNVRHKEPTRGADVLLMVLNVGFFLAASLNNLHGYGKWHGLFAIALAVIYLGVSVSIQKKKTGDNLLFLSLLGIGLALVTLAIPLQLDGEWITAAWLVEAVALVYSGFRGANVWVQRAGLFLLGLTSLLRMPEYIPRTTPPVFNLHSFSAFLAITGFFLVFYWFYSRPGAADREKVIWPAAVFGTVLALTQVSWEVTAAVRYFKLGYQDNFAVSLSWAVLAVILLAVGMVKEINGFRFIALALFGITVSKIMLIDLSNLAMIFRIVILLVMGAILVGVSFVYQRKDKKVEK